MIFKKSSSAIKFAMLTVIASLFATVSFAQFSTIVPMLPTKNALVFTKDGKQVSGKVLTSLIIGTQLKSFSIKDESGTKHKFKAADVLEVRAQMTGFEKLVAVSEKYDASGGSKRSQVMTIINATKDDIWKKDLVIFYQVEVKPGKFSLMQLLNPGTNTVISVYPLANTQGTEDQFYLAVKGKEVTKIVKNGYAKKIYTAVFGDCDNFMKQHPVHKKMKVGSFPEALTAYNEMCAPK